MSEPARFRGAGGRSHRRGRLVLLMGVSGCGKTVVGRALAARLGCAFVDADDLHPAANVERMRAGIPLDDAARAPWLRNVHEDVVARLATGDVVLACSALKAPYRAVILDGIDRAVVVHLAAAPEVLEHRLRERADHFMPASLLASQLADLEAPADALVVDVDGPVDAVVVAVVGDLAERD